MKTIKKRKVNRAETTAKLLFGTCAFFSVLAVISIVFFILQKSIPAFREVGFFNFLFGDVWEPRWEEKVLEGTKEYSEIFGIANILKVSLITTLGAVVIGGTFGVFTAVFLAYFCPKDLKKVPVLKKIPLLRKFPVKEFFEQVINLLASIPSIIVGFFGLVTIVPIAHSISPNGEGMGMFSAILVLSLMITPTVASLTKNSLESQPKEYMEGALGLGGTVEQAVFKVVFPSAKSGIFSALILGIGRAVGETMAVSFVIGGAAGKSPNSLFKPVGSLTTTIAGELGEAAFGSIHLSALTAMGFILLTFVLIINLVLTLIKRGGKTDGKRKALKGSPSSSCERVYIQKGRLEKVGRYVSGAFACAVVFIVVYLVADLFIKGLPYIDFHFLFGKTKGTDVTIAGGIVTTLITVVLTLLTALPLGIGGAIYLNEYAKKGSKFVKVVRLFIDTLSGVPSIVFGLFGMIFFCQICGLGYSVLAGSLTMSLIVLPTIIGSTEESLKEVPDSVREGSLALGASKVRTIFKVVLPSALKGIVTSVILSVGRIVGESAALIYTAGAIVEMPKGILSQGSTLSVFMYYFQCEGLHLNEMYATAVVLVVIVLLLNFLVLLVQKKFLRKS